MALAAQNLSALLSMTQQGVETQSAADAAASIEPDADSQTVPERDSDGKAKFAAPEAIATAVVGTLLLGPVGGLLLGGAQGWLKKKSDQSILDRLANEKNTLTASADIYKDQLADFKASATNPNDIEQIGVMASGLNSARNFMLSADPQLRAQGIQMLAGVDAEMNRYAGVQETQRVADESRIAQLKVELDDNQFSRYTGLQTDFDNQSEGYKKIVRAGNIVMQGMGSGSPSDLAAGIIMFNKVLDENSAVLGEERKATEALGSFFDKTANILNQLGDGEQLGSRQRRNLANTVSDIVGISQKFQLQLEAEFKNRVIDAELPVKFLDNFSIIKDIPAAQVPDIPPDLMEQTLIKDQEARDNQSKLIGDAADVVFDTTEQAIQNAADLWDKAKREVPAFNRALSGGPRGRRATN